jgi:glycosyltransferase involved in cell wall biosynthesis
MQTLTALSVVVPLYNEEENVEPTVREIHAKIGPRAATYEILLVDDGSRDRTPGIADHLAAGDPRVRAIHHPRNLGYGAALRSGFGAALHPLIFYTDGDLQFDLAEIDRLIPLLDGADIVTGFRINRQDPWHRRFNAGFYNLVMRSLFDVKLRDLDCAFKLYRRSIFDVVATESDGILISGEILVQAVRHGLVIREVGVTHYPRRRGVPTGNKPLVVLAAMLELASFCLHQLRLRRAQPYQIGKGSG